jgi:hypothetical protein
VTGTGSDYRELIPEFFVQSHFLRNENGFDLGKREGDPVGDVKLPPWANSAQDFVAINRRALENDVVSQNLHSWIDLIFGKYQRSQKHDNVFHSFCYADVMQQDAETVSLAKDHCANFGIIPQKLLSQPHPKREQKVKVMTEFQPITIDAAILVCSGGYVLTSANGLIHLQSRVATHVDAFKWNQYSICVISTSYIISAGSDEVCVHVFNHKENTETGLLPHRTSILRCFALASESLLLTGGSDCSLYLWDLTTLKVLSKIPNHSVPIIGVAACEVLDLCVSIDEEGTVSIVELTKRRIVHTFTVVDKKAHTKGVKMAKSGLIVVGAVPGNAGDRSNLSFYDLTGQFRGTVDIHGIVQEMELIESEEHGDFVAVTTTLKTLYVIDCGRLEICKKSNDPIQPAFLGAWNGRTVVVVKRRQNVEMLAPLEF